MDDLLFDIEAEDFDLFGEEDIEDFGEDIEEEGEDEAEEDYYEEPEAAEYMTPAQRRAYAAKRRLRAARARAARAARARAARAARARAGRYVPRPPYRPKRYLPRPSKAVPTTRQVGKGFQRVGADIQKTKTAVLENTVQSDIFSGSLKAQRTRIGRNEYALAASKAIDELKSTFPDIDKNKFLTHALPLAPLLALKPHKRGTGFQSIISDPRWLGLAIGGALAWYKESRGDQEPQQVQVVPSKLVLNKDGEFEIKAYARDRSGNVIPNREWVYSSTNENVATGAAGKVKADKTNAGEATIIVTDKATGLCGVVEVSVV